MNRFLFALSKITIPLVILSVNACIPKSAFAQSITLNAIDSGWYSSGGFHDPGNENYVVGRRGPLDYNNFFVFDLSGVEKPIASAFLRIFNPADAYRSFDPTETYTLFDVSTPVSTLRAGGFPLTDIYALPWFGHQFRITNNISTRQQLSCHYRFERDGRGEFKQCE